MTVQFLQFHTLTSYPAALLNRDDAGFAKRVPFGGSTRTRISSQCLKRHWRTFEGEGSLADIAVGGDRVSMSIRSRRTLDQNVLQPLKDDGVDAEIAEAVVNALIENVLGNAPGKGEEAGRTGQVTVLGRPEVNYLRDEARKVCAEAESAKDGAARVKDLAKGEYRKNLQKMKLGSGLDAALFGRMVTADILARKDAAVHVAHALTVHAEEAETDYFSAVDDLLNTEEESELGSGHIGTVELTSGLYYGYVVIDVPLLVSNVEAVERSKWMEADRDLAGEVVRRFIRIMSTVSPGAKLGSTAPYANAHLVLAEWGAAQPRTLANAFLEPVRARDDTITASYQALATHLADLDGMYGRDTQRRLAAIGPRDILSEAVGPGVTGSLDELAGWAQDHVVEGT